MRGKKRSLTKPPKNFPGNREAGQLLRDPQLGQAHERSRKIQAAAASEMIQDTWGK